MNQVPTIRLDNGVQIPQFGFGVFQVPPEETAATVRAAFDAGYRHIDTAQMYGNEEGVGRALAESGLPRDEVFVTTKLNNGGHGYDAAIRRLDESLQRLGYRLRRPVPDPLAAPREDRYVETWRAFEKALADGQDPVDRRLELHGRPPGAAGEGDRDRPAVNQMELHPRFAQTELRAYHAEHGIATEAWSPIGQGNGLLDDPVLAGLAEKHGKTPAQVVLRWHVQLGNIVFPKSMTPERMRENIDVFDFELADDDVQAISALDRSPAGRQGPNPDTFG